MVFFQNILSISAPKCINLWSKNTDKESLELYIVKPKHILNYTLGPYKMITGFESNNGVNFARWGLSTKRECYQRCYLVQLATISLMLPLSKVLVIWSVTLSTAQCPTESLLGPDPMTPMFLGPLLHSSTITVLYLFLSLKITAIHSLLHTRTLF